MITIRKAKLCDEVRYKTISLAYMWIWKMHWMWEKQCQHCYQYLLLTVVT